MKSALNSALIRFGVRALAGLLLLLAPLSVLAQDRCEVLPTPPVVEAENRREGSSLDKAFPVVDLLALVIPGAGELSEIRSLLETDVDFINQVLSNSLVQGKVRLVGVVPAPPSQPYRPSESTSEFLFNASVDPAVHELRDQFGADLVTFIVAPGMIGVAAGVGFMSLEPAHGYSALILFFREPGSIGTTLAHEVGHNLGLPHDRANGPEDGGPFAPKAWGHWGTLLDGTTFYDIMSYATACPPPVCERRVYFYANPDVIFEGVPMGIVGEREGARFVNSDSIRRIAANRLPKSGDCVPTADALCLSGNRFRVEATWETGTGAGPGFATSLTADTGYFWFFDAANVEVVVKVLDACTFNNRFWVFAGGLTNVKVILTVTDTVTGEKKVYTNPQGQSFRPIQDTGAFATCR